MTPARNGAGECRPQACLHDTIAITGPTGFIGRRLVDRLAARGSNTIRALVRNPAGGAAAALPGEVIKGDMRDPAAFRRLLEPGCTWISLAHPEAASESEAVEIAESLLAGCGERHVRRIVHCSSAVVVGRSAAGVITEATPCNPGNRYEAAKLAVEQHLLHRAAGTIQVAVLRPTAVYGPHGRNLVKLAHALQHGSRCANYLKSSLQGRRRMNLVHVDNVVAALLFLADAADDVAGETFIVSDDEYPANNYRDVERRLMTGLDIPDYAVAPTTFLRLALPVALRLAGRTNVDPHRIYDGAKIIGRGLRKPVAFEDGLADFVAWYSACCPRTAAG